MVLPEDLFMSPLWFYDYEEFDIFLNLKLRDQETKKKGAIFTGASKFILLPFSQSVG